MTKQKTIKEQIKLGVLHAAGWLLGIAWLALVFGGIVNAFGTDANFLNGHPSRILGYILLGIAGVIFLMTANRWKRVLPGIMVSATIGAWLELEHGHALNNPSAHISRSIGLVQLIVVAGVTALSFTFKTRFLTFIDRIGLLVFAASIYVGGSEVLDQKMPVALAVGAGCVLLAWAINRYRPKHKATAL